MKTSTVIGGTIVAIIACSFIKLAVDSVEHAPAQTEPVAAAPAPAPAAAQAATNSEPVIDLSEIYGYATAAVREKLKAPSTAKFSSPGFDADAKAVPYGYHQWLCSGWVDSQNAMGAMLRAKWGAYVFRSAVAVRVDYIELGDEVYGSLPNQIPFPAKKR